MIAVKELTRSQLAHRCRLRLLNLYSASLTALERQVLVSERWCPAEEFERWLALKREEEKR